MPPREFFIVRDYRVAPRVAAAAPSRATRPVVAEDHSDEDSLDGLIEASETLWSTLEAPSAPLWSREFEDSDTPRRTHWEDAEPARREEEAEPPRTQPRTTTGQIPKPRGRPPKNSRGETAAWDSTAGVWLDVAAKPNSKPARRASGEDDDYEEDAPPRKRARTAAARSRALSSKYYGVSYHRPSKTWQARYRDTGCKSSKSAGYYATEEEAAHAYNAKLRALGLESKRRVNAVDEAGRLVAKPKDWKQQGTELSESDKKSRYIGVCYGRGKFRAIYTDRGGKSRNIGYTPLFSIECDY